ncbi:MAG: prepilin-type N-terminal cleavage/methylation domain-containing protein [bacterium]
MKKGLQKIKGFTLIELLVVVGIIGILAAVIVAATSTARAKGDNAAIQRGLDTIRKQSEIYYTNNNYKYGTTDLNAAGSISADCSTAASNMFADPTISTAITQIGKSSGGQTKANIACAFGSAKNAWTFSVLMKNSGNITGVWCVDGRGGTMKKYASSTQADDTTNVVDTANFICK